MAVGKINKWGRKWVTVVERDSYFVLFFHRWEMVIVAYWDRSGRGIEKKTSDSGREGGSWEWLCWLLRDPVDFLDDFLGEFQMFGVELSLGEMCVSKAHM